MGARMMSGQTDYHEQLERDLAAFVNKEDAFLLNFGYQGMVSIIDAICGRNDVIVYDSEAHACILDGVRLHMGKRYVFPHNDIENLRKQLERATKLAEKQGGGILVITEGVFGMSGDLGKLDEIAALKKDFNRITSYNVCYTKLLRQCQHHARNLTTRGNLGNILWLAILISREGKA